MTSFKLIAATIFIGVSTFGFSQTSKELEKASTLTCDCLGKKDLKKANSEKIQMELGLCMIEAFSKLGLDLPLGDERKMEEIGGEIGLDMVATCPVFIEVMGAMMSEDPEGMSELMDEHNPYTEERAEETFAIEGKLIKVNQDQFTSIDVEDKNGKLVSLYWFEYFPGANQIGASELDVINKSVAVSFTEKEYYMPKFGQYVKIKIISQLIFQ